MKPIERILCIFGGVLSGLGVLLASGEYLNWLELMFALFVATGMIAVGLGNYGIEDDQDKRSVGNNGHDN